MTCPDCRAPRVPRAFAISFFSRATGTAGSATPRSAYAALRDVGRCASHSHSTQPSRAGPAALLAHQAPGGCYGCTLLEERGTATGSTRLERQVTPPRRGRAARREPPGAPWPRGPSPATCLRVEGTHDARTPGPGSVRHTTHPASSRRNGLRARSQAPHRTRATTAHTSYRTSQVHSRLGLGLAHTHTHLASTLHGLTHLGATPTTASTLVSDPTRSPKPYVNARPVRAWMCAEMAAT